MDSDEHVELNAWTGREPAAGEFAGVEGWGARRRGLPPSQKALLEQPPVPRAWWDKRVGYGLVVPDDDSSGLSAPEKAAGVDLPECLHELLRRRPGTAVLRWRPPPPEAAGSFAERSMRRYYAEGHAQDLVIGASDFGTGRLQLPMYLTIIGGPEFVPWSVQYSLGLRHAVGRLPLSGTALENYVDALLSGWAQASCDVTSPVVWSVDYGRQDITYLMRKAIAEPLIEELRDPRLPGLRALEGQEATRANLDEALHSAPPALLVTTSHGLTEPLDDPTAMATRLGVPVDADFVPLDLPGLEAAVPGGTIWYAHACCSAGSDANSVFADFLQPGSSAHEVVSAIPRVGATVAPAALRLLGRSSPIRALIGHVEPTFNWTLRVPETGQRLGNRIVRALSDNLHDGQPLGLAFSDYRADVGQLIADWAKLRQQLDKGQTSVLSKMIELRVSALDRQSLVLLGDPTVTLPPLPGG